ncbi:MAG: YihY/virulence factor BrkB family protein [Saprospiraceae bacterium]|nr:YihY/virulence factor BrkB family protein [Saprospiraceae bacterium]MCB9356334.1 YihY/virulence factor BrkB family protein [Lewinellaceae bacterium]
MKKIALIERVERYFAEHPVLERIVQWAKTHSLPGLKRIPLYNLLVFIEKETQEDAIVTRANSMAFSFFMAIFPAIIVLFTLLAYTPLYDNFDDVLRNSIQEIMPGNAGNMLFRTIEDIATKPRSGLLSFGFILSIWFASNGMLSMMRGLEKNYKTTFKKRTAFQKRLIAIQLTFLVSFVLVASVILVILGNTILSFVFQYIKVDIFTKFAVFAFRWVVVLLLFYASFSTIYRFGSSTRRPIPFFNPGALLATALSVLTSWGFSFYVDNFGNYNKLYGSIGTLIVLMVWMQLNCMILLIGFELNAGIAVLRDERLEKQAKANTES